ncbi:MAG: DUF366 family protein [Syntrophomonadaceae bacterium]|nr:DUF366 family protein [Syntrophomonadaceae bacterium]
MMKTLMVDYPIKYTGKELTSHWIYRKFQLLGDAVVAFVGEADVPIGNMVDLTDVKEGDFIYSPLMLHFIVEHFNPDLELAIYRQRILISCIKEELEIFEIPVIRMGDDLFVRQAKLSVSIATVSPTSTLIHTGLNIKTDGTPIKTSGLNQLGINDVPSFANNVMKRYQHELELIYEARCKVRSHNREF